MMVPGAVTTKVSAVEPDLSKTAPSGTEPEVASVRGSVPVDYDHRFHARLRMFQSLLLDARAGRAA